MTDFILIDRKTCHIFSVKFALGTNITSILLKPILADFQKKHTFIVLKRLVNYYLFKHLIRYKIELKINK